MKMKILSAAMLVGLGAAGSAQAVHINPDGHGQVLVYPYYTVQGGFSTYVHIVNTTPYAKAVKVRFLEGKNSQEVLDFNLYLSPYDEWAAEVAASGSGAVVKTADTSCIAPAQLPATGEPFRTSAFSGDSVNGAGRTREGYLEVIEMGVLQAPYSGFVTHTTTSAGWAPANCAAIRASASTRNSDELNAQNGISAPTGGLYGFASLINVDSGMKTSYDAVALDNWYFSRTGRALHTGPGNLEPNISQTNTNGEVLVGSDIIDFVGTQNVDNVSALIMKSSLQNDYVVDAGRASKTDWVITFPTKRFYVNGATVRPPFNELWSKTRSQSCDEFSIKYYDREEREKVGADDFSPPVLDDRYWLCNEVNTMSVRPHGSSASYETLFGASLSSSGSGNTGVAFNLADGFSAGWMDLTFISDNADVVGLAGTGYTFFGLPVIGFAAFSNTNGTLVVDGVNVLSNYMSSVTHKGERTVSIDTVN